MQPSSTQHRAGQLKQEEEETEEEDSEDDDDEETISPMRVTVSRSLLSCAGEGTPTVAVCGSQHAAVYR